MKAGRLAASLAFQLALLVAAQAQTRSPFGIGPPAPREAPPGGIVAWLLEQQAAFHKALTAAIGSVETSNAALFTLIGLAFVYGVIHAIGPGHGKAVIASYLVANERALKRGVALSFGAAAVQALVALAIVGVVAGLMSGTAAAMNSVAGHVEKAGFALVAGMGLWIVWRRVHALATGGRADACGADCGHDHGGDPRAFERARTGELVLTAIGAGIRPCTGAIILLVFALAKGLFLAGAISVAAMAVGTALGTSLFALLAVKAKSTALGLIAGRNAGWSRILVPAVEIAAGLALALLGAALFAGAMSAGS